MPPDKPIYFTFDYSNESSAFQKTCCIRRFTHKKTKQGIDTLYQSPVSALFGAPRQNKTIRSCGGTSTATSTDGLVFPFQPRPADAGLASDWEAGSDLDCPGAPRQKNSAPFRFRGLRKSRENCTSAESFFLSKSEVSRGTSDLA